MDNNIFNEIGTTLDLNGPILSFSEQPTGTTGIGTTAGATGGASVSFTGIATGVDPGTGYLSYQWYEENVGILEDSTYVTGTASTGPVGTAATLTISNLITPRDNQRKFYVTADYVPSAYGVGRSTGNAWNEPLTSGIGTVTVTPLIEVVAQPPEGRQSLINESTTISVNADLTDGYFADDLLYQWYLNGEAVSDGTKTVTKITGQTIAGPVEETYTDSATHALPAVGVENLEITLAAGAGSPGGRDAGGPGGNGRGGRAGRFSLPDSFAGQLLTFGVGKSGNAGTSGGPTAGGSGGASPQGPGGTGGGAGPRGWSGGGGGGGGSTWVMDQNPGGIFIAAGGGGGGGGGSWSVGGNPGHQGEPFVRQSIGNLPVTKGEPGIRNYSDGGGGGGGGGGSLGGDGGKAGLDRSHDAKGGDGGGSTSDDARATLISEWISSGDGYANIKYTGYTEKPTTTITNTILSGTTSDTLTISCDTVGVQTCQCKITSATASNSPIWTDVTNFVSTSTADQYNVIVEAIGVGITATLSSINLANGDYEFNTTLSQVATGGITKYYSFYAPFRDISVEMDLYGGKGKDNGSFTGGEGGYSRIRFDMDQNTEYVLVGLSSDINAPFLYRKAELMACVGGGGNAGRGGHGGDGGGVGVSGERGQGRGNGEGGPTFATGTLPQNGVFGSAFTPTLVYPGDTVATGFAAGRVLPCTKGVYWAQQGNAACADISGDTTFRLPDGTVVTNTANIARGFKAGYNIMQTAGNGNSGDGGNGAHGGRGSSSGDAGGGGGSGYDGGDITVVDTQRAGSTEDAKVILRVVT